MTISTEGIPPGTTLKVDIDPPGSGPTEVKIDEDGKASFVVPDNAESMIVTEPDSGAEAATTITP